MNACRAGSVFSDVDYVIFTQPLLCRGSFRFAHSLAPLSDCHAGAGRDGALEVGTCHDDIKGLLQRTSVMTGNSCLNLSMPSSLGLSCGGFVSALSSCHAAGWNDVLLHK